VRQNRTRQRRRGREVNHSHFGGLEICPRGSQLFDVDHDLQAPLAACLPGWEAAAMPMRSFGVFAPEAIIAVRARPEINASKCHRSCKAGDPVTS
jgi:hypothetical protein